MFLYPESCFNPEQAPTCIFVPDTPILNKLIEAVARTPDDKDLLYSKFSDMEQPRPQWLIEIDM